MAVEVLVLFKSYDWGRCMKAFLANLDDTVLLYLLRETREALYDTRKMLVSTCADDPAKEDIVEGLRAIYKQSVTEETTATTIVHDTAQACASWQ